MSPIDAPTKTSCLYLIYSIYIQVHLKYFCLFLKYLINNWCILLPVRKSTCLFLSPASREKCTKPGEDKYKSGSPVLLAMWWVNTVNVYCVFTLGLGAGFRPLPVFDSDKIEGIFWIELTISSKLFRFLGPTVRS